MPLRNLLDVDAELVGQVGELVHEADAGREHRVGGVFRELGRGDVHLHHAVALPVERRIEPDHELARPLPRRARLGADDDPVGTHEIVDRGASAASVVKRRRPKATLRAISSGRSRSWMGVPLLTR